MSESAKTEWTKVTNKYTGHYEYVDANGNHLFWDGYDADVDLFALVTVIDGIEVRLSVPSRLGNGVPFEKAENLLAKLASGWRPVNW